MTVNAALLRRSFDVILARDPELKGEFYEAFYQNLFRKYPPTWGMFFRTPTKDQEKMLHDTMLSIMELLDGEGWLPDKLLAMGQKHVEYKVTPEMYGWMREALLATIAAVMGAEWNDELAGAWGAAYDDITKVMLEGAAKAPPAPSA